MKTNPNSWRRVPAKLCLRVCVTAGLSMAFAMPASAVEFGDSETGFYGNWDTTVSFGQSWRVQSPDPELIGLAEGGTAFSGNHDDGTLNYDTGVISRVISITSEVEFNYKNVGFFIRGNAFYDEWNEDHSRERTPLSNAALDLVGTDAQILDAFAFAKFDLGAMPAEIRVGNQVINWGESTFFPGGINVINHINVSALRSPGQELREALVPQELAWFSLGTSENTNVELYYQFEWDATDPDPVGSAFGTNDFVPNGGDHVMLGFGVWNDLGTDFSQFNGGFFPGFQFVNRAPNINASNDDQYGAKFSWYFPGLFQGTEFGLYYLRYNSRLPLVNGFTGTQAGVGNATGAGTAVGAAAQAIASGLPLSTAIAVGTQAGVNAAAALGGNYTAGAANQAATVGANVALQGGDALTFASAFGSDAYADTAGYRAVYPEGIDLYGLSFNTQIFYGIAWQGEIAYRPEQPLLLDDVELLFAALSPINPSLGIFGQLGPQPLNTVIQGFRDFETYQFDTTLTKVFGPSLGANQAVLLWEGGLYYVNDMPSQDTGGPNGRGLRLNGPGTDISGNAALAAAHFGIVEDSKHFASKSSWGYRLVGRLDYNSLIGPWNVAPRIAWADDVNGVSPGPGGNFVEGRQALTLGVAGTLRNTWVLDMAYTKFMGGGHYNLINDRDFISLSARTSF